MTREEEIKKRLFEISTLNFYNSIVDSKTYFAGYIDGAMWADKHPHWISVEDELPSKKNEYVDNSILVLATDRNNVYKSRYLYQNQSSECLSGWFTYDLYKLDNITHWMPIPSIEHLKDKE